MLLIMLSAIQGWSAGTYNIRYAPILTSVQEHHISHQGGMHICTRAYKVSSSKDPVEMKVLVGSNEGLGDLGGPTVQWLPWQAREVL